MCMMSFVKDPVSIFFCGFHHKWTQKFQEDHAKCLQFYAASCSCQCLKWNLTYRKLCKAKNLLLVSRIIRKESSGKRQHCVHWQALLNHQEYWPFFSLWLRLLKWSVVNGVTVLLLPIQVTLPLPTLYMMSALCVKVSPSNLKKYDIYTNWVLLIAEAIGIASQAQKQSKAGPCSLLRGINPYSLALSHTCTLNTGQKLTVLIIYFTPLVPIEV